MVQLTILIYYLLSDDHRLTGDKSCILYRSAMYIPLDCWGLIAVITKKKKKALKCIYERPQHTESQYFMGILLCLPGASKIKP